MGKNTGLVIGLIALALAGGSFLAGRKSKNTLSDTATGSIQTTPQSILIDSTGNASVDKALLRYLKKQDTRDYRLEKQENRIDFLEGLLNKNNKKSAGSSKAPLSPSKLNEIGIATSPSGSSSLIDFANKNSPKGSLRNYGATSSPTVQQSFLKDNEPKFSTGKALKNIVKKSYSLSLSAVTPFNIIKKVGSLRK